MSPAQLSASAFGAGVFLHFIAPAIPHIVRPEQNSTRFAAVAAGVLVSLAMAVPAFAGSWLAFRALAPSHHLLPPLVAAAVGLVFAFALEPGFRALDSLGYDPPFKPLSTMLTVALAAGLIAATTAGIAGAIQH